MASQDEAAACIAVQPVGEGGRPRHLEPQTGQEVAQAILAAWAWMDQQSRRLVEDQDVMIEMKDTVLQTLRRDCGSGRSWTNWRFFDHGHASTYYPEPNHAICHPG